MRPSGKVNLIGLVIVAALIGAAYWVATFAGVYLDNLDVKEAVSSGFNQWGNKNEDAIRGTILAKLNNTKVGWHMETNEFGEELKVGGLGIKDEQVTIDADDVNKHLTVRVEYDRIVEMKPMKKKKIVHFVVEKSGPFPR